MIFICAGFGVMFGGATRSFAQTDPPEPMVGNYRAAAVTESEVVSAANYAVKAQAKKQKAKIKLIAVSRAEKQVVAGLNYRLCLQVEVKEKGKKSAVLQTVQTIVFLNLKQKFVLTEWAIAACTDELPTGVSNK